MSTELSADKVQRARANLAEGGLSDVVTVLEGNALETLADAPTSIDVLFIDGWKDLCLPVLRLLEPRLTSGALVLADDVTAFSGRQGDYLAYVNPASGYLSVEFSVGDGVELSGRI